MIVMETDFSSVPEDVLENFVSQDPLDVSESIENTALLESLSLDAVLLNDSLVETEEVNSIENFEYLADVSYDAIAFDSSLDDIGLIGFGVLALILLFGLNLIGGDRI